MQMQSTYWLEKVLKMISLYVNALLCTLQHINSAVTAELLDPVTEMSTMNISWAVKAAGA
jgi:hypothetical protein